MRFISGKVHLIGNLFLRLLFIKPNSSLFLHLVMQLRLMITN